MKSEVRKALQQGKKKLQKSAKDWPHQQLTIEAAPKWVKKQLVQLYLKSPHKVQYALAKYGIKNVVKKKKAELEEMLKH